MADDQTLNQKLEEYRKALEEEHDPEVDPDLSDKSVTRAKELVKAHALTGVMQIVHLAESAGSDSVRFSAAKWLAENGIGEVKSGDTTFEELFNRLKSND